MKRTSLIISALLLSALSMSAKEKKNILFIAIDDLKPALGCYDHQQVISPNIDQLAEKGVVFTNAHCQQAVCGPSRASLLTGMRPDHTKVWDLKTRMRDMNPDILSLPEHFKNNGYKTVAIGKIYDPRCVDKQYDGPSWTVPYKVSSKYTYPAAYGEPGLSYYALKENKEIVHKLEQEARAKGEKNIHGYVSKRFKPSTECADVPDDAYIDGQICNNALKYMTELSQQDEPFFLAVGFKRPHLPFAAPKKYWDMYKREEIPLAEYQKPVKDGVDIAYHNSGELYSYTDIPPLTSFTDIFKDKVPEDKQREMIHGYYACVTYIDVQVGRLMKQLEELGLAENTVVVLWGDHGWHLGDHAMWCKHSNFEQATRVPMIFSVPGAETGKNASPVEFVDIFPTLCDGAGIDIPGHLQGESLMPVMNNPKASVKEYAVSEFHRGKTNGYSIRTERYRMTVWMKNNYRTHKPFNKKLIYGVELYDYEKDPLETQNQYGKKAYKAVQKKMMEHFKSFIRQQNVELCAVAALK